VLEHSSVRDGQQILHSAAIVPELRCTDAEADNRFSTSFHRSARDRILDIELTSAKTTCSRLELDI
jgi:hypothetical protein